MGRLPRRPSPSEKVADLADSFHSSPPPSSASEKNRQFFLIPQSNGTGLFLRIAGLPLQAASRVGSIENNQLSLSVACPKTRCDAVSTLGRDVAVAPPRDAIRPRRASTVLPIRIQRRPSRLLHGHLHARQRHHAILRPLPLPDGNPLLGARMDRHRHRLRDGRLRHVYRLRRPAFRRRPRPQHPHHRRPPPTRPH